jgi:hypothetical protein
MKFESEEKRIEAMNALDPQDPESAGKMAEIEAAEIGIDNPPETPLETPPVKPDENPSEAPPSEGAGAEKPPEAPSKYEIDDLKGHKTPGELLKSYDNAQDLIKRQAEKIKEFQSRTDDGLKQRLEQAERELSELKKSGGSQQQVRETSTDLKALKEERSKIRKVLEDLNKEAEADDDAVFSADYQKRLRNAQLASINNSEAYDAVLDKLTTDLADTRKAHTEYVENQTTRERTRDVEKHYDSIFEQLDAIDDPEYKTVKPTRQLMHEYLNWQHDVATAYHGHPPKSEQEAQAAMKQLELRNPSLMQSCELAGIKTAPDDDMKRYIKKTELNLYRQGYRKNPVTGRFDADNRLKDASGKPIEFPTVKAALAAMRDESGYYKEREQNAFQQGAESLAKGMERRDQGAITITEQDQRKDGKTEKWAEDYLQTIDPDAIRTALEKKEFEKIPDYVEAMRLLGTPVT